MTQMNVSMKQEQNHGRIIDWWLPKVGEWELGLADVSFLCPEWINNKVLHSTENYIQYPVINHNGKKTFKRLCIYLSIYM